jgi:hypothetical protein
VISFSELHLQFWSLGWLSLELDITYMRLSSDAFYVLLISVGCSVVYKNDTHKQNQSLSFMGDLSNPVSFTQWVHWCILRCSQPHHVCKILIVIIMILHFNLGIGICAWEFYSWKFTHNKHFSSFWFKICSSTLSNSVITILWWVVFLCTCIVCKVWTLKCCNDLSSWLVWSWVMCMIKVVYIDFQGQC